MTTLEVIGLIANVLTSLGIIGALIALIWQFRSYKHDQRIALRDATLPVFRAWWGAEPWIQKDDITVPQLREAFFKMVGSPNEKPEETILAQLAIIWKKPEENGGNFGLNQVGYRLQELVDKGVIDDKIKVKDNLRKLNFFFTI